MGRDRDCSGKWQRYEAKYIINEAQAAMVRQYCEGALPADPYAARHPGFQYPILSVYLDSPLRDLFRSTVERRGRRFKLRVRTYRGRRMSAASLPSYFEIKRKNHGVVHKTRARLAAETADAILWDQRMPGDALSDDSTTRENLMEFDGLRRRLRAQPVVGVYYMREAYESAGVNRVRVTLDRELHYGLISQSDNGNGEMWWPVDPGGVILEIKFTNTYPHWVAQMLHRVELLRRGVCKYVMCSRAAGVVPSGALR
jgi:hypothetical protein